MCVRVVEVSTFSARYEFSASDVFLGNFPANNHDGYYTVRRTKIRERNNQRMLAESVDQFTFINHGSYGTGSGGSRSCGNHGSTIDVSEVLLPRTGSATLELRRILNSVRGN